MSIDFFRELSVEHSKKNTIRVAGLINGDQKKFNDLMKIFFNHNNMDLSRRAAWAMRESATADIHLIQITRTINSKELHFALSFQS